MRQSPKWCVGKGVDYIRNADRMLPGCRAGDACPYAHPTGKDGQASRPKQVRKDGNAAVQPNNQQQRRYQAPPVDNSRVVRPQPHIEDPRAFQVGQIERRYKPKVTENERESTYTFKMSPSDPDFPYEIEALECTLVVPRTYPETGRPSLRALNKDIPRGFQINIEKGFDMICAEAPKPLSLV